MTNNKTKKVSEGTAVIKPEEFPSNVITGRKPASTIANLEYLLARNRISVGYDLITKKVIISIPGYQGSSDNESNVTLSYVISLASEYGMSTKHVPEFLQAIADKNTLNPVESWIESKPWDGVDRLSEFYDTLTTRGGFPKTLKETLLHRWLLSAAAAAILPTGFKSRGVLTLQGEQSIGKTSWIRALIPDGVLRSKVMKLDHHLDISNKDTVITAISHWIVEIGELDSSFKKDVARLKGFLSGDVDKIRKPYDRTNSETSRRTVFTATVNDQNFLVDQTGNTRFWTLPVVKVDFQHRLDMQQVFAQILNEVKSGEIWWLTAEEELELERCNQDHKTVSAVEEILMSVINLEGAKRCKLTAKQLLEMGGIKGPTNTHFKEAHQVLKRLFGEKCRIKIQGEYRWIVPMKDDTEEFDKAMGPRPEFVTITEA